MKRLLGIMVLSLLVVGGAAAPATAATTTATVKGHVHTERGGFINRIVVRATTGSTVTSYTTTSNGYYSLKVKPGRTTITFTDPAESFVTDVEQLSTKRGESYVVDGVMPDGGTITGTVRGTDGLGLSGVSIGVTNTATGQYAASDDGTNSSGTFNVRPLLPGTYTLQFFKKHYFSENSASTFTVVVEQKTQAPDATLTRHGTISGATIVDGRAVLAGVTEAIDVALVDATGTTVATTRTKKLWEFDALRPGEYTVRFAPSTLGTPFFASTEVKVVLGSEKDVTGVVERITSVAASGTDKRTVSIDSVVSKRQVSAGTRFTVKATVESYGDPTGSTISLTIRDRVVATKTVGSTGKVSFSVTVPSGIAKGVFWLHGEYSGTDTTLPKDEYLRYMRLS